MPMGANRVKPFAAVEQAASERAGVLELCAGAPEKCGHDASERVVSADAGRQGGSMATETARMVL